MKFGLLSIGQANSSLGAVGFTLLKIYVIMRLLDIYSLCVNYSLVIESSIILILLVKDDLPFVYLGMFVMCVCRQACPAGAWLHYTPCTGPACSRQLRLSRTEHNLVRTRTIAKELLVEHCDWHFFQNCFLKLAKMHKRSIIR